MIAIFGNVRVWLATGSYRHAARLPEPRTSRAGGFESEIRIYVSGVDMWRRGQAARDSMASEGFAAT